MTYVSTWSGFVYAVFVVDTYSRRIVGLARLDIDDQLAGA